MNGSTTQDNSTQPKLSCTDRAPPPLDLGVVAIAAAALGFALPP